MSTSIPLLARAAAVLEEHSKARAVKDPSSSCRAGTHAAQLIPHLVARIKELEREKAELYEDRSKLISELACFDDD